ncbi:MAG: VCBS repeat-containing protein [Candidatus Saccharimonas sp.]|nr:VCBS repeat-containing protein [Planctomycetaceae bacterium]
MRNSFSPIFISLTCIVTVVVLATWLRSPRKPPVPKPPASQNAAIDRNVLDKGDLADAGLSLAVQYTGEIHDSNSLQDLKAAIQQRGPAGLVALETELAKLQQSASPQANSIARLHHKIGTLLIYEGRFDEAAAEIAKSREIGTSAGMPAHVNASMTALLGMVALRRGEVDNCIGCVGPSSCIFPIATDAIHIKPAGSRQAIEYFTSYLETNPGDLRVRWVLNLAYMTLGEYPDKVPPQYLVPLDTLASTADIGRFQNVAPLVGLISRGPNQAGGSVFDDFTGDGLPDLLTTSLDVDRGASLFVNRGDGTFEDQSDKAGLADQAYALNVVRADFDNDGNPDVLLLRGGWEKPMRMSLLRNTGNSSFEDVTIASGLAEPIATESASWGDYDNDGLVDLFVCGEYQRCRLYHNEGHGKFVDVASAAGVASGGSAENQRPKGSAWGDYDGDGRLDLFVSDMGVPSRLYHNEGNGTFRNVAPELKVTGPANAFACWFWDYDNDGRLDLYVNDFTSTLSDFVATASKMPHQRTSRPRLYRNLGADGFRDVTVEVGLDREMSVMGSNCADIDNDGFLDFYLGTGRMALEVLVPNLMFRNDAGKKFEDITVSSGTGHLQKGHGISFADWDCDGDLDFFVEAGGGVPGDRAYNLLFQNPGNDNHWLKVKLVGTKTNRAALGAQIKAVVKGPDGTPRSIYRTVGNNGSFGGNSLVESIGLLDATSVSELHITWPTSQTTQTFGDIPADQAIEITEGTDSIQPLPQPWVGGKPR